MEKIYITGTGRCGTTFLIKLFSFLNFDTGYTKGDYESYISKNCNSGMERSYNDKHRIIKDPEIINSINKIVNDKSIKIKTVIIPVRDFELSAESRVKHGGDFGGLWHAKNKEEQVLFYKNLMADYLYYMVKHDINTIFIDFDKMITDKTYLFEKLKNILNEKNIDHETFYDIYEKVSSTSRPYYKMVHPITFSIPNEKIIKSVNKSKDKFLSDLIPGDLKTYIYNTEEDYYKEYRRSFFAKTKKKIGWDCLRHYEIIANGCLPLFDDIENCPEKTLALFPKIMMKECHEVYENFDEQKYYDLLEKVLDYTRENLTTSQMCKYILKKSGHENVSRILFLSGNIEPDYLRCLTLHGFKETFGKMCHDYPIVPHIYKLENFHYHSIYGKGITYTNLIYRSLHDFEMDKNIIENIKNKFYDVVIYGSYHRGMPQYDLVSSVYKPNEIILLCGEDIHKCDYKKWDQKGHHVFVRELS